MNTTNQASSSPLLFRATLEDVSIMNKILHELHQPEDEAVLVISENGLRLITTGERTFQISAFFVRSIFKIYEFGLEPGKAIDFCFSLKSFLEGLNILRDEPNIDDGRGDSRIILEDHPPTIRQTTEPLLQQQCNKTSLEITYRHHGHPLRLGLTNGSNFEATCNLTAFQFRGGFTMMSFSPTEEIADIVFDSKKLHEWVSGLDFATSDFVEVSMGFGSTPVIFKTSSQVLGTVELAISCDEMIVRELSASANCVYDFKYRTQFMKPALEKLKTSTFMKMKCGTSGLLCFEYFHGPKLVEKQSSQDRDEFMTEADDSCRKVSSVEYFILSEAKPMGDGNVPD